MSPGSSTVDENGSSKLFYSMAQRQEKKYKCFPTKIVSVQGILGLTNGYTQIHNYKQNCQWDILYIRCTMNQQSWVWKEGILQTKWGLSAGGKWDVIDQLYDGQVLFTLKQFLTSSSLHQHTQRRALSVWKPLLHCCHLLPPVLARQFPNNGCWWQCLSVSGDACGCCCSQLLAGSPCAISISSFNSNTFPCPEALTQKGTVRAGCSHRRLHGPCMCFGPSSSRFVNHTKLMSRKSWKRLNFTSMLKAVWFKWWSTDVACRAGRAVSEQVNTLAC